ncbi:hypothetical protein HK100_005933 [Physocladia obscura]|uniref:Uncharacterized protein n=1 Tax=Physocladia obscura TaxID=109957 RepID=A0AAD5XBZ8_9FUNG|nr:hypothetical protein HK100_005933 [Physocladia obscura]
MSRQQKLNLGAIKTIKSDYLSDNELRDLFPAHSPSIIASNKPSSGTAGQFSLARSRSTSAADQEFDCSSFTVDKVTRSRPSSLVLIQRQIREFKAKEQRDNAERCAQNSRKRVGNYFVELRDDSETLSENDLKCKNNTAVNICSGFNNWRHESMIAGMVSTSFVHQTRPLYEPESLGRIQSRPKLLYQLLFFILTPVHSAAGICLLATAILTFTDAYDTSQIIRETFPKSWNTAAVFFILMFPSNLTSLIAYSTQRKTLLMISAAISFFVLVLVCATAGMAFVAARSDTTVVDLNNVWTEWVASNSSAPARFEEVYFCYGYEDALDKGRECDSGWCSVASLRYGAAWMNNSAVMLLLPGCKEKFEMFWKHVILVVCVGAFLILPLALTQFLLNFGFFVM